MPRGSCWLDIPAELNDDSYGQKEKKVFILFLFFFPEVFDRLL